MISILSKEQIVNIKESGRILYFAMKEVKKAIKPGISTKELNQIAESYIKNEGGVPAFKDYFVEGSGRYPATLCVSVNHHVVHGLPGDYILKNGDIISLDLGVGYKGMYTDMATTIPVGKISEVAKRLINTTEKCLYEGIKQAKVGNHINDIGKRIQKIAESEGFGVIRSLVGHGIGIKPHMPPQVPNFDVEEKGEKIVEGMAIAIEPMITEGDYEIEQLKDGWTLATFDNSLAAHFEHTIVIEQGRPTIVTCP